MPSLDWSIANGNCLSEYCEGDLIQALEAVLRDLDMLKNMYEYRVENVYDDEWVEWAVVVACWYAFVLIIRGLNQRPTSFFAILYGIRFHCARCNINLYSKIVW